MDSIEQLDEIEDLINWNKLFNIFPRIFWCHIVVVFNKCLCVKSCHSYI